MMAVVTLIAVAAGVALLVTELCNPTLASPAAWTIAISDVSSCPEFKRLPFKFGKIQLRVDHDDGDLFVNSDVIIPKDIEDPITLRVDISRCVTNEEASCIHYQTHERSSICEDIGKDGRVWSPILASIEHFQARCPVLAGIYKMVDAPLTRAIRDHVAWVKGYWRIKFTMRKDGKVIGCQKGAGEVMLKRRGRAMRREDVNGTHRHQEDGSDDHDYLDQKDNHDDCGHDDQ